MEGQGEWDGQWGRKDKGGRREVVRQTGRMGGARGMVGVRRMRGARGGSGGDWERQGEGGARACEGMGGVRSMNCWMWYTLTLSSLMSCHILNKF